MDMEEQEEFWIHLSQNNRLGNALMVLWKTVESALAYRDGALSIRFAEGIEVNVPPDGQFEA